MSLRPSQSWVFGVGSSRRASQQTALRQPASPPRPELRVLEGGAETQRRQRLGRTRIVASVTLVCLVLFGVVAFHVVLSQGQFKLDKMQTRADDEQAQFERLRLQVAQLESPKRITDEATNRLGMIPADKVTAVTPQGADVSPAGVAPSGGQQAGGDASNDYARAKAWAEVKPHLSSSSK